MLGLTVAEAVRRLDVEDIAITARTGTVRLHGQIRARTGAEMMLAVSAMPQRLTSLTRPLLVLHGSADRLSPQQPARSSVPMPAPRTSR